MLTCDEERIGPLAQSSDGQLLQKKKTYNMRFRRVDSQVLRSVTSGPERDQYAQAACINIAVLHPQSRMPASLLNF